MHGDGSRRVCPECGQGVAHISDQLSHRELRGPRNITSSNPDRIFDDNGRLLFIEEKRADEPNAKKGQLRLLLSLAEYHDVWAAKGEPNNLTLWKVHPEGRYETIGQGDFGWYQERVLDWFK